MSHRQHKTSSATNYQPHQRTKVKCESQSQLSFCVPLSFNQELTPNSSGILVPLSTVAQNTDRIYGSLQLGFNKDLSRLEYSLFVYNAIIPGNRILDAHIHGGAANQNGPILAVLFESNGSPRAVNGLLSHGFIENKDITTAIDGQATGFNSVGSLYEGIRSGVLYANVHSEQFPDGIIRGQIYLNNQCK